MSRTRQFHQYFQIKLSLLEIAQIRYYAHRYNKDMTDVLRGMMRRYIGADQNFDLQGFQEFVAGHATRSTPPDPAPAQTSGS